MKNLFVILVVFFAAFVIGCNDNPVTDPLTSNVSGTNKTSDNSSIQGVIPVKLKLKDPNSPFSELDMTGRIAYEHRISYVDPSPKSTQSYISLKLAFEGELKQADADNPAWTISSESNDNIAVVRDGIYTLEKYVAIQGKRDGTVMVFRFFVTTDGVDLNSVWLSPREVDSNHQQDSGN